MKLEFDPNNPTKSKKVWEYATYIPSRTPNFKMHEKRNHAANALNVRAESTYGQAGHPGILYQFINNEWVEVDRYEPPTTCAHCDRTFTSVRDSRIARKLSWYSWIRTLHDDNVSPQYKQKKVCGDCYDTHFAYNAEDPIPPEHCGLVAR